MSDIAEMDELLHQSLGLGRDFQRVIRVGETVLEVSMSEDGEVVLCAQADFDGGLLAGIIGEIGVGGLRYVGVLDDRSLQLVFRLEDVGQLEEVERLVEVIAQ